jgi:hypothetical protein
MCVKKILEWFGGKPPVTVEGELVDLSLVINDYAGSANDLNGCERDQENAEKTLKTYWPFKVYKFKNSEVTRKLFKEQLTLALQQKWDTVILFMDCCFSEDNTRALSIRTRFVPPEKPIKKIRKHIGRNPEMKWIAFSACQDYQTAADAYIGGAYNGAFTYFAMKALKPGMTYKDWYEVTKVLLRDNNFEQIPEIQGPDELLNKKVFSDKTLFFQYSGHGTPVQDKNGDEADGQDEALYLYDGVLLDDELHEILTTIS